MLFDQLRHLMRSTAVTNQIFSSPKKTFLPLHARAARSELPSHIGATALSFLQDELSATMCLLVTFKVGNKSFELTPRFLEHRELTLKVWV